MALITTVPQPNLWEEICKGKDCQIALHWFQTGAVTVLPLQNSRRKDRLFWNTECTLKMTARPFPHNLWPSTLRSTTPCFTAKCTTRSTTWILKTNSTLPCLTLLLLATAFSTGLLKPLLHRPHRRRIRRHVSSTKRQEIFKIHAHIHFSGSPRQYLEHYIFPVLTEALEYMLRRAKEEKCFEVSLGASFLKNRCSSPLKMYVLLVIVQSISIFV